VITFVCAKIIEKGASDPEMPETPYIPMNIMSQYSKNRTTRTLHSFALPLQRLNFKITKASQRKRLAKMTTGPGPRNKKTFVSNLAVNFPITLFSDDRREIQFYASP
jgi:hypothetical protein